jgi:hypothetical protein
MNCTRPWKIEDAKKGARPSLLPHLSLLASHGRAGRMMVVLIRPGLMSRRPTVALEDPLSLMKPWAPIPAEEKSRRRTDFDLVSRSAHAAASSGQRSFHRWEPHSSPGRPWSVLSRQASRVRRPAQCDTLAARHLASGPLSTALLFCPPSSHTKPHRNPSSLLSGCLSSW